MALPLQFAYRTQKAVGLMDADPTYRPVLNSEITSRFSQYSPCGRWFAWATPTEVTVCDASTSITVMTLGLTNVYELDFSPKGSFLSTWERPSKDEAGDANKNLKVWRVEKSADPSQPSTAEPVGKFVQKQQDGWHLAYTSDEKHCARLVTNEVQFFQSGDLQTVWNKLRVEGVKQFALAPGPLQSVAVYVPQTKGFPASVKIFDSSNFSSPMSQKSFFKSDKVKLSWNNLGTALLVEALTEVDKSNKSYYGETILYLLSAKGEFDARVTLDKDGPIHDVAWSPNSKEFGVVYGYMPAKTTIFNHRAVATHSFPIGPRNKVIFSPTGRFVLVAGFGNLAGQMDVYDMEKDFRKLCTIESGNPSICEWSPDSRYIMTATLSPRLRVDNGVKLWHVTGPLMYNQEFNELYSALWRPLDRPAKADPLRIVPPQHSSATKFLGTVKTPSKPAGAYRPPGARGLATPLHFKREDEGGAAHIMTTPTTTMAPNGFGRGVRRGVPGAEPAVVGAEPVNGDENLSKAALKNKKRRGKKANAEGEGPANGDAAAAQGQGQGAMLAPPRHQGANGSRSPDRKGHRQNRSVSRPARSRSNTARSQGGAAVNGGGAGAPQAQQAQPAEGQQAEEVNPNAKKIRSLQKKIRAIEELEMRLARREKLEDTQMKKISTKEAVLKELAALGEN
ncbi:related to eukaryotic translation initiation factor 3 subunit 9 [Cephalotrichum gorgonifer]|uniref:Eukaryotic translation initiation factor 2A n=1 Tax=Cephalotrichum gorgonifer TaxID=2041049 RepID=A0AAE8MY08_9PEZI|nr:related to eukaryotic translation initiation factor 3 subunit 9 [Cephalotrichum gorgonifer]